MPVRGHRLKAGQFSSLSFREKLRISCLAHEIRSFSRNDRREIIRLVPFDDSPREGRGRVLRYCVSFYIRGLDAETGIRDWRCVAVRCGIFWATSYYYNETLSLIGNKFPFFVTLSFCVVVDVFFTQRPICTAIGIRNSGLGIRVLASR